ncbi:MAG: MBL fold metallo-hydrolase [Synergistales bacterium]|nr:MBL fold metallo-hydrolase [Synergistales bacterium]
MNIRRFPLGPLWTNGYLLWDDGRKACFIDPGGDPEEVLMLIGEEDLALELILLTHGHADHIWGLERLRSRTGAPAAIHREDAPKLADPSENLSAAMGRDCRCAPPEQSLEDGNHLQAGAMAVEVLHTPGHTPGGCSFLVSEGDEQALFSGDTLFAMSIGRTDLPGGDERTLRDSLKRYGALPDGIAVYPGHGPETTLGEERRTNPFWPR